MISVIFSESSEIKYFRFGWPYCYFRLSINTHLFVDTFFQFGVVENFAFANVKLSVVTFLDRVMSSVTWPLDSRNLRFGIRGQFKTKPIISCTVLKKLSLKFGVMTIFVTWRHLSRDPGFKVTVLLKGEYLENGAFYTQSYYRTVIGNHMQAIEWCHFRWPWVTPDPGFKETVVLKGEYLQSDAPYRHSYYIGR